MLQAPKFRTTEVGAGPGATTVPAPEAPLAGIAGRMDALPLCRLHVAAVLVCSVGLFADIAEVAVGNVLAAVFLAPPYGMARADLSLLLASIFAGGALGSPIVGALADRFGRRRMLQASLAFIAATSLGAATSETIAGVTAFRFAAGLAIGAYPPLTSAYLSDILPPARRGTLMMVCGALAFLGAPAVILLVRHLSPETFGIAGWRWGLVAGCGMAALAAILFGVLPESPRWLEVRGRTAEAVRAFGRFARSAGVAPDFAPASGPTRAATAAQPGSRLPASALLADRALRRRMLLLGGLYLLGPWATLGFPLLSGAVMVSKGFAVADSVLFAGLSMLGPTVGILACSTVVDRLDRRLVLVLCTGAMAALGLVFASGTGLTPLVLTGIAFNLAAAVYSAVLAIYGAEMFPTALRASATGFAWAMGRLVSIFVPLTLLPVLAAYGGFGLLGILTAAVLTSLALIVMAGPPGLARRPVD